MRSGRSSASDPSWSSPISANGGPKPEPIGALAISSSCPELLSLCEGTRTLGKRLAGNHLQQIALAGPAPHAGPSKAAPPISFDRSSSPMGRTDCRHSHGATVIFAAFFTGSLWNRSLPSKAAQALLRVAAARRGARSPAPACRSSRCRAGRGRRSACRRASVWRGWPPGGWDGHRCPAGGSRR